VSCVLGGRNRSVVKGSFRRAKGLPLRASRLVHLLAVRSPSKRGCAGARYGACLGRRVVGGSAEHRELRIAQVQSSLLQHRASALFCSTMSGMRRDVQLRPHVAHYTLTA